MFGSTWFVVSEKWLQSWRMFISGQTAFPPGPIDNSGIDMSRCKPVVDYRCVNQDVWSLYKEIYGGGPEIIESVSRSDE